MKKLKVIEESRFLNAKGMQNINGGTPQICPGITVNTGYSVTPCVNRFTICSSDYSYRNCGILSYEHCDVGANYETLKPCMGYC